MPEHVLEYIPAEISNGIPRAIAEQISIGIFEEIPAESLADTLKLPLEELE